MKYKKYSAYKDSGVEWLGTIPNHWATLPIKYIASSNDDVLTEETVDDFEIEYVEISGVDEVKGVFSTETHQFKNAPSRARRRVRDGDIIISTVRTYLKAIASIVNPPDNLIVSTGFAVIRPKDSLFPRFASYLFKTNYLVHEVIARSTGISYPAINTSELVRIYAVLPPHDEQTTIAAFLNNETAQIDTLIAKQERLIATLQEKRQALIAHTVTKGLNPKAPMKDSAVDWLGEVPAHWEVTPTKRIFSLIVDPAPPDNDYELLSLYTAIGVKPRQELEERGNRATTTDGYLRVRVGDIIVNKLLAWMGAIGVSEYEGVTSPAYDILRPSLRANSRYYSYLFRCGICLTEFKRYSRGIMEMRLRLYFDQLGRIKLPVPPLHEQNEIVNYLENELSKLDDLVTKAQNAIQLLQERRTALISAAVTGKIDVRAAMD